MSRTKIALALCTVMLCVLALHEAVHSPAAIAEAQEPITTPEPIQPIGPVETFTNTPEPTIAATATPEPTQPSAALGEALPVLINARLDLDVLANDRLGGQQQLWILVGVVGHPSGLQPSAQQIHFQARTCQFRPTAAVGNHTLCVTHILIE